MLISILFTMSKETKAEILDYLIAIFNDEPLVDIRSILEGGGFDDKDIDELGIEDYDEEESLYGY